ncbi:MAG: hypothetical protein JWO71_4393 [Candidatus Acidoferrum typicum]|nr:hypothetical protein [Candidatus Acidoferrum typicum]
MCSTGHTPKERSKNLSEGTVSFLRRTVHNVELDQGGYRNFSVWSSRVDRLVFGKGHAAAPACAVRGLRREGQTAKFHQ